MSATRVDPGDEGRHEPEPADPLWNESWYFDFATPDGSLGGYVRVGLYPNLGTTWYWAYLVGPGRPLVAVRDHDVPLPRGPSLELRAEGLWADTVCEAPLEHWSVNLEAFAVALDDPAEAYRAERGDRVGFGLDLEWVAAAPAQMSVGLPRYEQPCAVQGEVLVGEERISVDAFGERDHSWGHRDWWTMPWCWTAGRLGDGTAFHAFRPLIDIPFASGFVAPASAGAADGANAVDVVDVEHFTVQTELGAEGLPTSAAMELGDLRLGVTPVSHAPVLLEAPDGRVSRFPRSLCRFESTADGRTGWGWTEWCQPPPAPEAGSTPADPLTR
ncbi:MAG: hypothetical protein JO050_03675 [Acidimicrobiia bacterium]|nr:hypothetical protein [Acidimicrobiia bacterium]